jgi:hypothetical protein
MTSVNRSTSHQEGSMQPSGDDSKSKNFENVKRESGKLKAIGSAVLDYATLGFVKTPERKAEFTETLRRNKK